MKVNIEKIKFEIQRLGLTQKAFADQAGVTRQTLFNLRKDEVCRMKTLTQIAKALRIPVNELVLP